MAVVLYINNLGDDALGALSTIRRYYDMSFFEVNELLEREVPIELPPLDDSLVADFTRDMLAVQSSVGAANQGYSMEQIFDQISDIFNSQPFGSNSATQTAAPAERSVTNPGTPAREEPITAPGTQITPGTQVEVRITDVGSMKLSVVKLVKEWLNCSLAEAKDSVDNCKVFVPSLDNAETLIKEMARLGCRALIAGQATSRPVHTSTLTAGKSVTIGTAKPAASTVSLEITEVSGGAFKILGILTKAFGLSYSDAGKYLRNGARLPELPADQAAQVADQLRAIGCTVRS